MRRAMFVFAAVTFLALSGEVVGQDKAGQGAVQKRGGPAIAALKQLTVVSADAGKNTLTVRGGDGGEQEIALAGTTKIKKDRKEISLSDIAAGEAVTVYFRKTKDGQKESSTVKVMKPKK